MLAEFSLENLEKFASGHLLVLLDVQFERQIVELLHLLENLRRREPAQAPQQIDVLLVETGQPLGHLFVALQQFGRVRDELTQTGY